MNKNRLPTVPWDRFWASDVFGERFGDGGGVTWSINFSHHVYSALFHE
jgi:hypothetical protein